MAKYTVTHSCGHDQDHQLFGPTKDRESRAAWLQGKVCTECWRESQKTARDAAGPHWVANVIPAYDPEAAYQSAAARAIREQIALDSLEEVAEPQRGMHWHQDKARAERAVTDAEYAARAARSRKASDGALELICLNSYTVKDQLKARGYQYNAEAYAKDLFGRCEPGWVKRFAAAESVDPRTGEMLDAGTAIADELRWIGEQGWTPPEVPTAIQWITQTLGAGRWDLLPVPQHDTVAAATAAREYARVERAERRRQVDARIADEAERNAKAATFRVGDRAGAVRIVPREERTDARPHELRVAGRDGRIAWGWCSDDGWFVTQIERTDGSIVELPPGSQQGGRIGREAREQLQGSVSR